MKYFLSLHAKTVTNIFLHNLIFNIVEKRVKNPVKHSKISEIYQRKERKSYLISKNI